MKNKVFDILEIFSLVGVPIVLILCCVFRIPYTALVVSLVIVFAFIPFFLKFEHYKPLPKDFIHIVVFSSLAIVGRIICTPFASVQPVTAIVIVTGILYGKQSGMITGIMIALVSNMFLGQGPWTPWQMYAWGVVGYLSGVLGNLTLFEKNIIVYIWGILAAFLYGFILDSWYVVAYVNPITWVTLLISYANGIIFNIAHSASTAAFLIAILIPWRKKIERLKTKYGIAKI